MEKPVLVLLVPIVSGLVTPSVSPVVVVVGFDAGVALAVAASYVGSDGADLAAVSVVLFVNSTGANSPAVWAASDVSDVGVDVVAVVAVVGCVGVEGFDGDVVLPDFSTSDVAPSLFPSGSVWIRDFLLLHLLAV
ncbi:hypothetical protein Ancab_029721 [Ancistrocladus abbreviatus]